ncbi:fatty acid desaturase family protein [Rhizobiaceae bacterium n13]|uniref:Fatty acid desaturase family protein n=1 Tax=Ferirhizobium litorale TaxID=2927786 RepID=A0AAE3QAA8_9HYPH|nr:fatty acid desaturase family protein [Fererhizobium litorale]MDI7861571.1 fatty acid desaturase family protein [Fererhizobium litorale]MDI7922087.1 fatty acid desaturase family protein [Fererhizobium litorale]
MGASKPAAKRDYSMLGESARSAIETGLASAKWYHTEVPRKTMKELMQRSDGPAVRDTVIWLGSMIVFAGLAIWLWPSWWSVPFFLGYGVLYGSASDSRWHECGHGTAFKTRWMNDAVYQIASFMMIRNPVIWRWSHTRHHTDTIIVGRDPEIVFMKPIELLRIVLNVFGILDAGHGMKSMVINAFGRIDPEEKSFVPDMEQPKVIRIARMWFAIYAATIVLALAMQSILPLMLVGFPRLYGAWHHVMTGLLQHGGLADNVTDHRLNSRTVLMNPISRFIYWNMNYHVEHHMFPMVPYHALPRLHALIRDDLPAPNTSIWDAYKQMWPAVKRQLMNEEYFLKRELPPTAKPYRAEFHDLDAMPMSAAQ